jgi:hypothetical protein
VRAWGACLQNRVPDLIRAASDPDLLHSLRLFEGHVDVDASLRGLVMSP